MYSEITHAKLLDLLLRSTTPALLTSVLSFPSLVAAVVALGVMGMNTTLQSTVGAGVLVDVGEDTRRCKDAPLAVDAFSHQRLCARGKILAFLHSMNLNQQLLVARMEPRMILAIWLLSPMCSAPSLVMSVGWKTLRCLVMVPSGAMALPLG